MIRFECSESINKNLETNRTSKLPIENSKRGRICNRDFEFLSDKNFSPW